MRRITWMVLVWWSGIHLNLMGRVLMEEGFAYPDGPLVASANGLWVHHGGQQDEVSILGEAVILTQTQTEDVHVLLEGRPYSPTNGESLFASFTVNFATPPTGANGGYFAHFKDLSTGYRCRVFAATNNAPPGCFRLGLSGGANAASVQYPLDLELGQVYRVILEYGLSSAASWLWLNPDTEESTKVTATDTATPISISGFAFRQNQGIGGVTVDDLRIGTSFLSVCSGSTEEPTAPRITRQPENRIVSEGQKAEFSVAADGSATLRYQWQFNQVDIPEATNAILILTNLTLAHAGNYRVLVSNDWGSLFSSEAQLQVEILASSVFGLRFINSIQPQIRAGEPPTNSYSELVLFPSESLSLEIRLTNQNGSPFTLRASQDPYEVAAQWELPDFPVGEACANFHWQPNRESAGVQYLISLEAHDDLSSTNWVWTVYVPTAEEQGMVLNEFLANPSTSPTNVLFNPFGRNPPPTNPSAADEFIELVNSGTQGVDLTGWSLADATKVRHRFPEGFRLGSGESVVVYGGPKDSANLPIEGYSQPANDGTSGLALNNTGTETILLRNAAGHLVSRVVYTEKQLSTRGSLTRYPTFNSGFVSHDTISGLPLSPGAHFTGQQFSQVIGQTSSLARPNIRLDPDGSIVLEWNADPTTSYSVWESDTLLAPFTATATGLYFSSGRGEYKPITGQGVPRGFYRLGSP